MTLNDHAHVMRVQVVCVLMLIKYARALGLVLTISLPLTPRLALSEPQDEGGGDTPAPEDEIWNSIILTTGFGAFQTPAGVFSSTSAGYLFDAHVGPSVIALDLQGGVVLLPELGTVDFVSEIGASGGMVAGLPVFVRYAFGYARPFGAYFRFEAGFLLTYYARLSFGMMLPEHTPDGYRWTPGFTMSLSGMIPLLKL